MDRLVSEDSYFDSVQYEELLELRGPDFIGVVKQSPCQYLMVNVKRKEFTLRGGCYGLVSVDERELEMMEFSWVYCDRCYIIATRGSLKERKAVSGQI